jgi:hypothetical protein
MRVDASGGLFESYGGAGWGQRELGRKVWRVKGMCVSLTTGAFLFAM